jgi:hypothetical protein
MVPRRSKWNCHGFGVFISGGCEGKTGAIDLMKGPVPYAQPRVKTGLSATAVGGFGLDTGLFVRPVATMRFMAKIKAR